MFFRKASVNKSFLDRLKTFSVTLLLLLYVAGNVQVETFHQFFHSLEKALHSTEQEKDPCHRAVYHDSKKEGCNHKTHITAVKKCPLCHVVPLSATHIATNNSFAFIGLPTIFNDLSLSFHVAGTFISLPARAPPVS